MESSQQAQPTVGKRVWRRLALLALALLALFAVAASRAAVSCRREVAAAESFIAAGDLESALLAARHAAEWYVPLDRCSERGLDLLEVVRAKADAAGNGELALFALRSSRTSIMLTRGLTVPHAERLPRLHAEIARRMAAERVAGGKAQPGDEARYFAQLEAHEARRPNPWLALAGSLAFMAWIGAMVGFAWNGITSAGTIVPAAGFRWGGAALLLLALWLTLVRYA
jgi:hypothetical protein